MYFGSEKRRKQMSPSICWKLYILLSPNTSFITWMVSENHLSVLLLSSMLAKFWICFSALSFLFFPSFFFYFLLFFFLLLLFFFFFFFHFFLFFPAFPSSGFLQHWGHAISISWETPLQGEFVDNCLPWIDCKYWTVQIFTAALVTPISLTLWTCTVWTG